MQNEIKEKFALLPALHNDDTELDKARNEFLASLPKNSPDTQRLRLVLLQQLIAKHLDQGKDPTNLFTEHDSLLRGFPHDQILQTRAKLLRASYQNSERKALFNSLTAGFAISPSLESSTKSGRCPNSHLLQEFCTPEGKFCELH